MITQLDFMESNGMALVEFKQSAIYVISYGGRICGWRWVMCWGGLCSDEAVKQSIQLD